MSRVWLAALLPLCACVRSMVPPPGQIPSDGVVECTDSLEQPIAAAVGAVVSAGALAYAMAHLDFTAEHGGILWAPVLAYLVPDLIYAAGVGTSYAQECRVEKRLGAEQAERARRRAEARAEAGALWKRGAAAARADDCAMVRELDPQIRTLDIEFHDVVFARDVAIARCLAGSD